MPEKKHAGVQRGTTAAPSRFRVLVEPAGPYLVYGAPPLNQQFYVPDAKMGGVWYFQPGESYDCKEPTALCRCGESRNKPYCDGSHVHADWNPRTTASRTPLLEGAQKFDGPTLTLTDNRNYCAFARFCDPKGQVWRLVEESDDPSAREVTIREANHCPAGRLHAWDEGAATPHEPEYEPSLGLNEDPEAGCSGPLWVRGGIAVEDGRDGFVYEVRNRMALCRCGQSSNKPYCDGTHASMKFRDGLNPAPKGEKY